MKKLMKSLMLFAAAAMALTSCENEPMNEGIESNDTFTLSFTADAPESRTSVDIDNYKDEDGNKIAKYFWSVDNDGKLTDRVVFLQTQDANTDVNTKYNDKEKSSISKGVATFVTDFTAVDDATTYTTYNYAAIYPAQSISGTALTSIGVKLPASQTLTEGNYAPDADLMMSKLIENVEAKDGHGGNLEFTRLAAIGKMNLKLSGMETGEKIEKVVITFEEEVMNGDVTLNFTDCTATYAEKGSNTVTLSGSIAANADRTAIFFTCFPGKYSGAYSVEVTTDKATYSNTGKSIDEDKALEFKAGDVLGFNLTAGNRTVSNIETYTKVTKTNLADYSGTYLLVYEAGKVAFDGSLATLDAANNNKGVEITNNTITGAYSDYTFTIAKVEGGYSIKSASGKYIGRSATSNGLSAANTYGTDYLNTIENLVIKGKGGASLKYNKTSDQNRFRYFASGQESIALYRLNGSGSDDELVKTLESISVSGQTTTFEVGDTFAFNGTVTAKYNDNTTAPITGYTVDNSAVKMDTAGTYTVKVTYEGKETSYTITVKEAQQGGGETKEETATLTMKTIFNDTATNLSNGTTYNWGDFKVTFTKNNSNTSNYNAGDDGIRWYKEDILKFAHKDGYNITKIVINASSGYASAPTADSGTIAVSGTTLTWSGKSTSVAITAAGGQIRFKSIDITYEVTGGNEGSETPSEPVKLATPTELQVDIDNLEVSLTWTGSDNATSYYVTCGDQNKTVTGTSAQFTMTAAGTYDVSIVAKADGYTDSEALTGTAITEEDSNAGGGDVETIVTANFAPGKISANNTTKTDNKNNSWVITTDATYFGTTNGYIQVGSNNTKASHLTLTSTIENIKSVTVYAAAKASTNATIKVYIGSTLLGTSAVLGNTASSGGTEFTVNNTNNISGALKIVVSRPSSASGALYFNSANVTYAE